jgi:hypothetical protein
MELVDLDIFESVENSILKTKTSSRSWMWNLLGLGIIIIMLLALYITREPESESGEQKTQRMINDTIIPKPTFSTFLF